MRWLITGGCGFIGTSLIKQLIGEGSHLVRVVDDLSVGTLESLSAVCRYRVVSREELDAGSSQPASNSAPVEVVVGDVRDDRLALSAARGMEVIVHLAANTGVGPSVEDPRHDCITNVLGTLNYLEAARHQRMRRFVFASSGAPVGTCTPPIREDLAPHPVSPYGASKLAGEGYCSAYFHSFGVETISLRFGNVYGPLSAAKNSVVAKFIRLALQGKALEIYGDGQQSRDFIYVDDIVGAIRQSVAVPGVGGETFQIATNAETTLVELLQKLLPILAEFGFAEVQVTHGSARTGDVRRNYSDTSKARQILQWRPHVALAEGLKRTVRWFVDQT